MPHHLARRALEGRTPPPHGTRRHPPSRWQPATARSPASRLATAIALWSFAYAGYRAYYAAGGQFGMIGEPQTAARFRVINAAGAAIVLLAGLLPLVAVRVRGWVRALPALRGAGPSVAACTRWSTARCGCSA